MRWTYHKCPQPKTSPECVAIVRFGGMERILTRHLTHYLLQHSSPATLGPFLLVSEGNTRRIFHYGTSSPRSGFPRTEDTQAVPPVFRRLEAILATNRVRETIHLSAGRTGSRAGPRHGIPESREASTAAGVPGARPCARLALAATQA